MPRLFSPRVRLALVMTLSVYPMVTIYLYVLAPLTAEWTVWQRTLILTPVMVVSIIYGVLPAIHRLFGRFLSGGRK